jgi:fimbrial chaperone protein
MDYRKLLTALGSAVVAGSGLWPLAANAGAFSVTPVRIFFSPRERAVAITVSNEADVPVALQVSLYEWGQKADGSDDLAPTDDLILAPPLIRLAAKAQQVVRLALLRAPDSARQLSYRMILREVPEALGPRASSMDVPVALALSLPVFVSSPGVKREVRCSAAQMMPQAIQATCTNVGNAYAQVREATLRRGNVELARFEGGSYILPGRTRPLLLARRGSSEVSGPVELNLSFDDGQTQVFELELK